MKFRFYITNLFDGKVEGTDDAAVARDLSVCCDYFVVDTETGQWIIEDGEAVNIEETKYKIMQDV